MAFLGNSDPSGGLNGTSLYSAAVDITTMTAALKATVRIGQRASAVDTGKSYIYENNAGVGTWTIID